MVWRFIQSQISSSCLVVVLMFLKLSSSSYQIMTFLIEMFHDWSKCRGKVLRPVGLVLFPEPKPGDIGPGRACQNAEARRRRAGPGCVKTPSPQGPGSSGFGPSPALSVPLIVGNANHANGAAEWEAADVWAPSEIARLATAFRSTGTNPAVKLATDFSPKI
jgi:hypothetical protein